MALTAGFFYLFAALSVASAVMVIGSPVKKAMNGTARSAVRMTRTARVLPT